MSACLVVNSLADKTRILQDFYNRIELGWLCFQYSDFLKKCHWLDCEWPQFHLRVGGGSLTIRWGLSTSTQLIHSLLTKIHRLSITDRKHRIQHGIKLLSCSINWVGCPPCKSGASPLPRWARKLICIEIVKRTDKDKES